MRGADRQYPCLTALGYTLNFNKFGMDRVLMHYPFLLKLATSTKKKQLSIITKAKPEQILAIIDCVKIYQKSFPNKLDIPKTKRIKQSVLVLKGNRRHLKPVLCAILLSVLRECLHYVLFQQ